ncbi:tail length tape measure protein [Escherichia phage Shy]|uniref:Tail length tape-measure protein n=1 Tax=Escherichia phage Halfdan TaxID=2234092 RepID=A0A2Z5H365_9CAUD|nr:tail length tape-measure protein [Escherichia phage Halfdan]AXC34261.1 tail length tape-measure protein [Escherichia phage Halfdan]WQZ00293.1 tail length tape measure protein [Escherichia phage Shy]
MADEQIVIEITDGVAASIPAKIDRIAASARNAHTAVETLKQQLAMLDGKGLQSLSAAMNQAASASTKLAQAQQAANTTAAQAAILQNRVEQSAANAANAQARLATASTNTATAQQRLATATANTATAEAKLATETAKTSTAQSNSAAAASRAELASIRLQQAQKKLEEQNQKTTNSFMDFAKRALSIAAITAATGALLKYADSYTALQNKLQNVSSSQAQVNELTDRLYELANKTRAGVDETATAFTRFDRSLKLMGKSQEDTLRMTETINKALVVSGATSSEASSALLQLSQAFNSGKLQGDEFRSVSENMPVVLDAVAKALNKPVDQVKKLGTEGKITSEVLFKAFQLIQQQIDDTFAKTTPTIGQAMTVLNNQVGQFVGKLDKATGVSSALAKAILWLGNNLDLLTVALVAVGAALLVAFGPALLSALGAATTAVIGFTAALAANPIGLIAIAITTAIAALTVFGDKISVTSDGLVNLQDVAKSVLSIVGDGFSAVGAEIQSLWGKAIDWINEKTNGWGENFRSLGDTILSLVKATVNGYIGAWVSAYNVVKTVWDNFPALMKGLFALVVNAGATAVETLVNSWQIGIRGIASLAEGVAPELVAKLNGALDKAKIELPRMQIEQEAKDAGSAVAQAAVSGFQTDYVGGMTDAIMQGARKISEARRAAEAEAAKSNLRGAGTNQLSGDDGKTKKAKLTQEQKDYNKALKEVTAPLREYNAAMAVAKALYDTGAISLEKYNALVAKAKDAYASATDPLYSFNKAAQEQFDVLSKVGPAMEAERNVIQARNAALQAGLPFSEAMAESIRKTTVALDEAQKKSDVLNKIYSETKGAQADLTAQQQAYNQALANGAISAEQYGIKMQQLNVDAANLKMQMGTAGFNDAIVAGMGQLVSNYQGVLQGLSGAWGNFFTGFVDGFANSIGRAIVYGENLQDTLSQVSKQILSELIGALIKVGIQYVVNQALAQTAITATTAQSTAAAATTTAAWAPAAAVTSAASFGGAAVAGIAALAVLFGMVMGFAAKGFKTGGYTGDVGTSEVAGVVHGQEFVVNAAATRKHRATLEAMNNGGSVAAVNQNSDNAGNGGGGVVMVAFDIDNNITVQGGSGDSSADSLEKAATAISQKTQADIMDSIRMGGTWSKVIKQAAN